MNTFNWHCPSLCSDMFKCICLNIFLQEQKVNYIVMNPMSIPHDVSYTRASNDHDDVIKWKHFPRNWPFVRGIHRSRGFPHTKPVTRSFDVFFDLRLNKRLSKQPWGWWFETRPWSLWRHCNDHAASHYLNQCVTRPQWVNADVWWRIDA